jgi:5-dehydro-2-deoxygluconokinase
VSLEVLCMGRAGVDLYAEQIGAPLERVTSFAKYVGGCAANIAVGSARLGLRTGMLTRVADDPLGHFVRDFLASEGVDVSAVRFDSSHLTGLAILGIQPPDAFPLVFYREQCADIQVDREDVDRSGILSTRALVVTGTGFSHEPSRDATRHAMTIARTAGVKVVLDLDVRPVVWAGGSSEIRSEMSRALPLADVIVGTEEEVAAVGGTLEALRALAPGLLVVKRGERGATAYPRQGAPEDSPGFRVPVLNTVGAGDGFMAGFLHGWMRELPLRECLRLGNAAGALVASRHACAPAMPRPAEIEDLVRASGSLP